MIIHRITSFFCVLLAIIVLTNCKNKAPSELGEISNATNDSITTWIASSSDRKQSEAIRKDFLIKAYDKTLGIEADAIRLSHLSKIQYTFLNLNDSLWFRKANKRTNELATKMQDSMRIAGTYWDLGIFLDRNEVRDSAYYHFSNARKLYEALGNNHNAGKLHYDMAHIQVAIKDYTGGEINCIQAIEMLKPLDDQMMLFRCYNMLGIIAKDLEEYQKSLAYYSIAEEYLKKSEAGASMASEFSNNLGVTYLQMGEYEKATSHFRIALNNNDGRPIKKTKSYARVLNNWATSQYLLDSETDVADIFMQSLQIRDSLGSASDLAGGHLSLAEYYIFKKDTLKALNSLKKSKKFAIQSSNNYRLLESLELLSQLDPENAALHSKEYIALNHRLQSEERKIRNKATRISFETHEVLEENKILSRRNQVWTGIAISILLLSVAGYIIFNQRSKNQKLRFEQEQQFSNQKIFNLMLSEKQKFEEGKKLEQKRISEELHDGVLGKMLGARMLLTGLNKKDSQKAIKEREEAITTLQSIESELRDISHELSHVAYQEIENYIRSLQSLLERISDTAGIHHNFSHTDKIDWDNLNGDIKINLYRMVQESLQNVVKHANCKNIELHLDRVNDNLQVLIIDDGIGFDFKKRKRGIGIRNIRSRINKLNGSWYIDSKLGIGTTIRLILPIVHSYEES